jgi:integrase
VGKVRLPKGLTLTPKGYVINKLIDCQRIFKRLGNISESDAVKQFSLETAALFKGERITPDASSLTVYYVMTHYYESHLKHIKSGENARWNIPTIDKYIGSRKVMSLKKSDMELYKVTRGKCLNKRNEPISARTIQSELQFLSMAINRAVDDELLPRNPIARFCKVTVPRRRKIVLDHGQAFGPEWILLYKNIPEQWRLFFLICYETGMRPNEVASIDAEWIEQIGRSYMIKIPSNCEKTGFNDRRIPVSKLLEKRLLKSMPRFGKLFSSWDYFKAFRIAVKNAGLPPEITAYSLRRTRATIWDEIDSSAARVALGHVPLDPHEESYVVITNIRLFKLVQIDLSLQKKIFKIA